jgi:beta-lactamase class D
MRQPMLCHPSLTGAPAAIIALAIAVASVLSCQRPTSTTGSQPAQLPMDRTEVREEFKAHFDAFDVDGAFLLYDMTTDRWVAYHLEMADMPMTPASTFKIMNSLVGVETGVIDDWHFVIPWDGVMRQYDIWNRNHTLQSAFTHSAVWYYQELARRVGEQRMRHYLKAAGYGNQDMSGGIDRFWLTGGGLRITPLEQIEFLRRLHDDELPFSKRTMNIVKDIMVSERAIGHVIRSKTGWGSQSMEVPMEIGWYIGWLETPQGDYLFATCLMTDDPDHPQFIAARREITFRIFRDLGLIQ